MDFQEIHPVLPKRQQLSAVFREATDHRMSDCKVA